MGVYWEKTQISFLVMMMMIIESLKGKSIYVSQMKMNVRMKMRIRGGRREEWLS